MIELVDDAMVDTLAVRGTPEECAAELHRRFGDLAERVCCYFPGYDAAAGRHRRPGRARSGNSPFGRLLWRSNTHGR